ncbi:MAG: DEAD/DEAH box helicase [Synergistaceae bacterium]|nr:DEAD/DEAH box helicase [Synergistaceae bacterium]
MKEKINEEHENVISGFEEYPIREELLLAIRKKGFNEPTPVQRKVLELDNFEQDLIVRAKTGSGKTLAFLLPLLENINPSTRSPLILILSPTRELTQQTEKEAVWLANIMDITAVSLVGGLEMAPQIRALREGAAIVVGTPGRTLDHINRGTLNTANIRSVVLDEGDLMLDMGFREELEGILDSLPTERRTWLFSATMPEEVRQLAMKYLKTPHTISLVSDGEQHEDIAHKVYLVPMRRRFEGLVNVLLWERPKRSLIFCHTRMDVIEVSQKLQEEGFGTGALHGEMTQRERNAILLSFKSGAVPLLVATNVAARGLDVEGVSHVIQLGLPEDMDTFVHRSGRTGRAGNEGTNLILLSPLEAGRFKGILRSSKMKIEWADVPEIDKIRESQREIAEERLLKAQPLPEDSTDYTAWAADLLERAEPRMLIAKLLSLINSRSSKGYNLSSELERERERRERSFRTAASSEARSKTAPRSFGIRPKGTVLRFKGGRGTGLDVGKVLRAICSTLDVGSSEVGAIRIGENTVDVELLPVAFSRYLQNMSRLAKRGLVADNTADNIISETRADRLSKIKESKFSAKRSDYLDRSEVHKPYEKHTKWSEKDKFSRKNEKWEKLRKERQ